MEEAKAASPVVIAAGGPFAVGARVEVHGTEDGYLGSWYRARVLEDCRPMLRLSYLDFEEDDGSHCEGWVDSGNYREALPAAATATTAASDEERLRALFDYANKSKDGKISVKEMMVALRHDEGLAAVLHLPGHIHQEDGTRKAFESVFSALDSNGDRVITWDEFKTYFMAKHF